MARLSLAVVLLMGACAYGAFTTCNKDYNKLGCFWEDNTNMELIINDRDPSSPAYSGHMLDWNNFGKSIHSLACRCSAKAKAEGYAYFSLRFWAECWAGKNHEEVDAVVKDPTKRTNQCANDAFKTCDDAHDGECVGRRNAEYMYTFAQAAEESLDGGWSEYSEWSDCSSECGPGIQTRERTCTEPEPLGAGKDCVGESTETKTCEVKKCPIDGGLSSWSKFTTCTRSCGGGASERVRFCNNPKPQFGGKPCVGTLFETKSCGVAPCPVDGDYTSWSSFGSCTKSCGGGNQERSRTCTNPAPAHGGKACVGPATEEKACNTQNCPINGGYTSWSSYGSCSKTCGKGTQLRTRTCTNPTPQFGGAACAGAAKGSRNCKVKECPIDGGWTGFGAFGKCSKSCGDGTKTRTRTCTNPKPQFGGKACIGSNTSYPQPCKDKECPIDGGWTDFGSFGKCSKSCGAGTKTKTRTCTNPKPQFGGKACAGSATSSRTCKDKECPINGGWSSYSSYGSCSKICGSGTQSRSRTCTSPKPQFGGAACSGSSTSSRACNTQKCPINGGWSGYGSYGSCSKECGSGTKTRSRSCNNPAPQFGGASCSGSSTSSTSCNTNRCATQSDVKSHVDGLINSYGYKNNADLATLIRGRLDTRYSGHYFVVAVYDGVSGYDKHAMKGTNYITIFRKKNHNVVVSWVDKNKSRSKSKASSALSKVKDSGDCYAKNQNSAAWGKVSSQAVMTLVVRHGCGLRASYSTSAATTFNNYRCKRDCDFWGNNCDHNSSLVMMFGSA